MSPSPLLDQLKDNIPELSRNQRVLAKYVLGHYQAIAFSTINELARDSGVSVATIVRFAKALGFRGYPAFQKEIRRLVRADLKGPERFTLAQKEADRGPLTAIIEKELENISDLRKSFDGKSFRKALQTIRSCSEVIVVGTRSTASLANHFWFGLSKLAIKASRVLAITSETYDDINARDRRACVIAIGFPRYLREQVELLGFVRERKLATIAITDSEFSPLHGDVTLYAPAESASFVAFHAAPLILINALLHELSVADKGRTLEVLGRFEAMAEQREYFHNP